ncbi:uncharacterized protein LOC117750792 isoform X2 [Cyclopterus lumpus]|uniref:uncharacterized protein LOC117750792 isoform X2 n=2 Tax=Cyclopterus lumpus TaxID=8103 RepID=UPI001486E7BB|nr:uncharacterized protein LOC117750792 isoform X2 [Cyclopterus lumpus]
MLKFHSVFLCLMGIMFNRDHAALLSIQLLTVCQVFAVSEIEDRNELVSRGDSVVFTCNISDTNETQLTWTKDRFVYAFSFPKNLSISNFTSRRLRIDNNLPSRMIISNVQHDDAGTYRCCLIAVNSTRNIEWDLKVSGEPEASPLRYPLYILTAVIGFLLCVVTAVCLCSSTTIPNQHQESETLSYAQFHVQSGKEVAPLQPHSCAEYRTNHKHVGTSRGSVQYVAS